MTMAIATKKQTAEAMAQGRCRLVKRTRTLLEKVFACLLSLNLQLGACAFTNSGVRQFLVQVTAQEPEPNPYRDVPALEVLHKQNTQPESD